MYVCYLFTSLLQFIFFFHPPSIVRQYCIFTHTHAHILILTPHARKRIEKQRMRYTRTHTRICICILCLFVHIYKRTYIDCNSDNAFRVYRFIRIRINGGGVYEYTARIHINISRPRANANFFRPFIFLTLFFIYSGFSCSYILSAPAVPIHDDAPRCTLRTRCSLLRDVYRHRMGSIDVL